MSDISNGSPNNMQETKGCCEKCHIYLDYKDSHQCNNSDCPCHNSSNAFIEEVRQTAEMNKRMGANEFKQKVLEALKERFKDIDPNDTDWTVAEIRTIISNLEV